MILTGTRKHRLDIGKRLGADAVVNVNKKDPVEAVERITGGKGVQYVLECSGAPNALTHTFPLAEVPTAIRYARERIDDAIKVVVKIREN